MDKSRQRKHQALKSNLNFVRETFVLICSIALWLYSAVVLYTFITVFLSMPTYVNHLVLTVLKVNFTDIINVFSVIGIISVITVLYLIINYQFNKYEVSKGA